MPYVDDQQMDVMAFEMGQTGPTQSRLEKIRLDNIKHKREVDLAKQAEDLREYKLKGAVVPTQKRNILAKEPIGTNPTIGSDIKRGAQKNIDAAQEIGQDFITQGIGSEQNRVLSVHMEHAKSLSGEKGDVPKATPTQYGIKPRGSNSPKSQFSGSGRYNVRLGPKDSFTGEQMETLGRPKNWTEAVSDQQAFGKEVMIDLEDQDWLRLQQGKVSDDELVSHKMAVEAEAQKGNIFIDAESAEEIIQDIDSKEAKGSLVRHYNKPNLEGRTNRGWIQTDKFNINKLQIGEGLGKQTGRLSKAQAMAELGLNVSAGNIPGAVISGSALSAHVAAQNPTVQKKFAELIIKIVQDKGAKKAGKLIPGVDVGISAMEAWGYITQGRMDQAGIAALSGAIGWVPVLGDFGAALLDAGNLAIDYSRGDFSKKKLPDIVGKPQPDPKNYKSLQRRARGILSNLK